jgi:hypothetical protein
MEKDKKFDIRSIIPFLKECTGGELRACKEMISRQICDGFVHRNPIAIEDGDALRDLTVCIALINREFAIVSDPGFVHRNPITRTDIPRKNSPPLPIARDTPDLPFHPPDNLAHPKGTARAETEHRCGRSPPKPSNMRSRDARSKIHLLRCNR